MAKRMTKGWNSTIAIEYGFRIIGYVTEFAHITKSTDAGLFLSQLLFWWEKGARSDYIYKTINEMRVETGLTRAQQDGAIKKWKALGVLKVENRGVPQKRHFYVNIEKIKLLLDGYVPEQLKQADEYPKQSIQYAEISKLSSGIKQTNTEMTPENTSETTSKTSLHKSVYLISNSNIRPP
jgi:hypothetical protein